MSQPLVVYISSITSTVKVEHDCHAVQQLLDSKKVQYELVNVAMTPDRKEDMQRASGKKIVPQVLLNGEYLGNAEELQLMEDDGMLDDKLVGVPKKA